MNEHQIQVVDPQQQALVQQRSTPGHLLQVAIEKNASIEMLERLLALQLQWEANEARKSFTDAMAAFKCEPITIYKNKSVGYVNKKNEFVGYTHADLGEITSQVCPLLAKHGLSHSWKVKQESGWITVECVITHRHGHSESVTMSGPPDDSGQKNAIQKVASTTTYLQRYTLLAITGLSTRDADDDGAAAGLGTAGQPEPSSHPDSQGLPNVPAGYVDKWIDGWAKKIMSGSSTTADLLSTLRSKYTLTDAEVTRINAIPATYSGVSA